jgi:hypothetical protein
LGIIVCTVEYAIIVRYYEPDIRTAFLAAEANPIQILCPQVLTQVHSYQPKPCEGRQSPCCAQPGQSMMDFVF